MEQVTAVFWCIFLTVFTSAEQATSFRNAFIEVDNSNLNAVKNGEVFNRVFHQCSVDANCKFVLVDTQINVFKMYTKKVDLPSGNQKMRIWEKHSQGKYKPFYFLISQCSDNQFVQLKNFFVE